MVGSERRFDPGVSALLTHSAGLRRKGTTGAGAGPWGVGMPSTYRPIPYRCDRITPCHASDQTQCPGRGLEAPPPPDLPALAPPASPTSSSATFLRSLYCSHTGLLLPLTGMLLPQGFGTCRSHCLAFSALRFPHGSLSRFIQVFAQTPPLRRGLLRLPRQKIAADHIPVLF